MYLADTAFATEVSQIYWQTNVKIVCNDASFWATVDLLEIELSTRAQEDEEEKRKQKSAGVAIAAFTSAQKGSGKTKPSQKPICRDFLTDNGCPRGGQCTFQHPQTVGRCLRCGSTKHAVANCKKPRKDATTTSSSKGKGKGSKANSQPEASSSGTPAAKPAPKAKAGRAQKRGQSQPKAKAKAKGPAHGAEAGNSEIDWARIALEDSNAVTEVFSASLASFAPTDVAATLPSSPSSVLPSDSYVACSFYTTFNSAFHTSEVPGEDGLLSPILDTGATHCLTAPRLADTSSSSHIQAHPLESGKRIFSPSTALSQSHFLCYGQQTFAFSRTIKGNA